MARFLLRRLLLIPLALILVNFLGFAYAHFAGPLRAERTPFAQRVEAGPFLSAYTAYLRTVLKADFGMELNAPGSVRSGPVALGDMLGKATQASLGLLLLALALSVGLGLATGLSAVQTDPPGTARWLTVLSTVGLAMPSFYIGSLFIVGMVFYVLWRGPGTEMPLPLDGFGWDAHLVFPTLALMARPTVQIASVIAGLLSGELGKQYVVAARSLGYTWRSVRNSVALRNVIAPVLLTIAGMLRLLVGELVLIEWLFRWPGLGRLLAWTLVPAQLSSARGAPLFLNPPVMADILTIIAALFLVSEMTAAALVRLYDPRWRSPESDFQAVR
jgi:peptide/nickel transport system permease protein